MSVPRAGTGAYARAGTAGIDSSYGRQVGVMEDGQLQGQPALYAAGETGRAALAKGHMECMTRLMCSQVAARELSAPAAVTDRVNARSIALADVELRHHDVVFPSGNSSDRLDVAKENKCAFSASHNLLKLPGTFRLIVRLLIPGKGKTLSLQRGRTAW